MSIKINNLETFNFEGAIRGMRNPMNSWDKSDSIFNNTMYIGNNDLDLMRRLYKAGNDHRKYLRQIMISVDITAPLYWWKEFDTYKVGTTANSTSTMHKIMSKEFEDGDFSYDFDSRIEDNPDLQSLIGDYMDNIRFKDIRRCNQLRRQYLDENSPYYKSKAIWRLLVQTLPSSYNQTRTVTMSYENFINMYFSRKNHKLSEWVEFCDYMFNNLPYIKNIMEENK